MKIAIHERKGSFSDGWIQYCKKNNIEYKLVNCYNYNIIELLKDCDGLMWHWDQNDYKAPLFARQLTISLSKMGLEVFPNIDTVWHFDDKLGQKYLLESINAPYVTTYASYSKKSSLEWANETSYPKVFKLRGGASGINVLKVENRKQARRLIHKAFGNGFSHYNKWIRIKDRFWILRRDKNIKALKSLFSSIFRYFYPTEVERFSTKEKGYVLFQDFIPNNTYDTRLIIVGNRCFGTRRYCRPDDFRASGSGLYDNSPDIYNNESIKIAFDIADKLGAQSIAYDFLLQNNKPVICEISYIYCRDIIANCDGYWDRDLNWHKAEVNAERFIIEDFINNINK
ncbi:RimK family alpha-L-glutamate ligase [Saccharicrinis sp. FJH54]|uniref:ATP-grasp domain-containing protein n=1 Tax=Saccharicrinis sp. FJH54 TaxID=3344665 RepID=UPI0035D51000